MKEKNLFYILGTLVVACLALSIVNLIEVKEIKDSLHRKAPYKASYNTDQKAGMKGAPVSAPVEKKMAPPKFDTIEEYADFVLNPAKRGMYAGQTKQPEGFVRIKAGTGDLDIAPDGLSGSVHVLGRANGNTAGTLDTIQPFYLEVVGPSPCWAEEDCNLPMTQKWYGPFEGPLGRMTQ